MTEQEWQVVRLKNDFYRDGFRQLLLALGMIVTTVLLLTATSLYLFIVKPVPVKFATLDNFRLLAPVPVDKSYLNNASLLQWVSEAFSTVFNFDFINYAAKSAEYEHFFTENGLKKYKELLDMVAPITLVQTNKAVVTGAANGGPVILNQGLLSRRYAWWVQVPVNISVVGYKKNYTQSFVFQVLVVRIPTLDNLSGIAIENIVIANDKAK